MANRVATAVLAAASLVVSGCGVGTAPAPGPSSSTPAPPESSAPAAVPTPSSAISVDSLAPAGWVDLATADPTILVEIRYATAHNFVGRPVAGYLQPLCLLPSASASALATAQRAALAEGYTLKVYDCYRPMRATADFVAWRDTPDETTRAEFYPGLTKQQVFDRGFVAGGHSNHSTGGAVDVTLVRLPAAPQPTWQPGDPLTACTAPDRFADNSIDMGTGYDCFDSRAHTLDAGVTGAARENRLLLRRLMGTGGFTNYAGEWWHYDLAQHGPYQDFPVAAAALR